MSLTFTDIFCGAGGSSIGLAAAGFELRLAANHWDRAIETHAANFTEADHLCADISNYDMRRLPRTDVLWASPECTWHSPAGGRRRLRAQLDLLDDYVPTDGGLRSRATMFDVIRAAEVHEYPAVVVENVVEVTAWPLFEWWLTGMENLGYRHTIVCASSAHVWGPTNLPAPQWRDRLYVVFTKAKVPRPDVALRPLAWCPACGGDIEALQAWKRSDRRPLGKYGQQYAYRCPRRSCRHHVVEPYVLPAASAVDWADLGQRIGDRERDLADATMRRIRAGLAMFAGPAPSSSFVVNVNHGGDLGRPYPVDGAPFSPRTTKIGDGLVNPFITMLRAHNRAQGVDEPLATLSTGRNHGLTVPPGAFLSKHHGGLGYEAIGHMNKSVEEPMPGIVARPNVSLVIPYRRCNRIRTTAEPLAALHTRDSAGLCSIEVDVEDCHFRMLKPREHLRGQRFPDSYIVRGNKGEQTMQAGNAVSSNVAQWLGDRLAEVLA